MTNFSYPLKLMKALVFLLLIPILGYSQYYNDVLSYRFNGTPTNGIKIQTNMPYVSNQQMPTIMIEGYNYSTGTPIDLKIVYYIYADKYINYKATSTSSYTPDIYLSEENGKVVIFIDDKSYYVRFHIRTYANMSEQASWFTGWTHSDTPKASGLPAGREVLVPYDVPAQNPGYYSSVLSYRFNGTPTNGIKIHTNMPFISNRQMPTIMIEGYNYSTGTPIDLKIVYYIYGDKYINYKAVSTSSYTPDIYLSKENGKVTIFIDDKSYYTRFHVRTYAYMSEQAGWFTGWTQSDTPKATGLPTGQDVLVPYDYVVDPIWENTNDNVYYLNPDGKVGIGTSDPTAELTVNGYIHAKEVRVYTDAGADFVFDENYDLIDIDELEKYVSENKHLPDIPSEKEMIEEGLHLGDMDIKLLQKVEELTLYIIDMNKKLEALSAENEKLKNND